MNQPEERASEKKNQHEVLLVKMTSLTTFVLCIVSKVILLVSEKSHSRIINNNIVGTQCIESKFNVSRLNKAFQVFNCIPQE